MSVLLQSDLVPDDAAWLEARIRKPDTEAGDGLTVTMKGLPPSETLMAQPLHTPFTVVTFSDRVKRHREEFMRACFGIIEDGAIHRRIQWYKMPEKLGESIAEPKLEPQGDNNAEAVTQADAETAPRP